MKNKSQIPYIIILFSILVSSCGPGNSEKEDDLNKPLPILGNYHINEFEMEGKIVKDTIHHKIGQFKFTNHEGREISNFTTDGKVYVADFSLPAVPPYVL